MKKSLLFFLCCLSFNAHSQGFVVNNTMLMQAAERDDIQMINNLVQQGYDVNETDMYNNTAYCYAYYQNNYKAAQVLKYYGADITRECTINNVTFRTNSVPYYNKQAVAIADARAKAINNGSSSLGISSKTLLYTAAGVAGVGGIAMAASGGGGSDSSSSSDSTGFSTDITSYQTAEFYGDTSPYTMTDADRSPFLDIINAQYAYAKGFNGAGITIGVLDTGIDIGHSEFIGQLNGDLTNTNQQGIVDGEVAPAIDDPDHDVADGLHGTNVAGTIAANRDGNTMHGVAYEATILPYRMGVTGDATAVASSRTDEAILDGINKGATIFNLSYGRDADAITNATTATKDAIEGSFTGSFVAGEENDSLQMTNFISEVTSNDIIIVQAAGNEEYTQSSINSALPLQYTQFDGFYINVVALNKEGNAIATTANSGWGSNQCGITQNYCIAAPGTDIMTTTEGGLGYAVTSGTSFASPIVAGSVALVKNAFPYLTAPEITDIIFKTATDLGDPGIDDIYGRGVINLDAATTPGAELLAIGTGGSPIEFADSKIIGSTAMAQINVPDLVITDELNRTFTISGDTLQENPETDFKLEEREQTFAKSKKAIEKKLGNGLIASFVMSEDSHGQNLSEFDLMQFSSSYENTDVKFGFTNTPGLDIEGIIKSSSLLKEDAFSHPYLNLAEKGFVAATSYQLQDNLNFETSVFFGNIDNDDNQNLGKSVSASAKLAYTKDDSKITLETGFMNENDTVLGSKFEGAFALAENNYTYFTGVTGNTKITDKLNIFANAYIGLTKADTNQNSLVNNMGNLISHAASLGVEYTIDKEKSTGLVLSQPLRVSNGAMDYSMATSRDINGDYHFTNVSQDLSPDATEIDVQAFYKQQLKQNTNLNIGALHRFNAGNQKDNSESAFLAKLVHKF
ncbi:MAG: S8 family serine peptidase [Alphaproteobacteria bacterium]|nr:S8 family serine peptidase [Alphaproteobacteria bacterium]